MTESSSNKKTLMRCLGEFTGYIAKGLSAKVDTPPTTEISRSVEETTRGDVTLRRTTIEEIQYHGDTPPVGKDGGSCS